VAIKFGWRERIGIYADSFWEERGYIETVGAKPPADFITTEGKWD